MTLFSSLTISFIGMLRFFFFFQSQGLSFLSVSPIIFCSNLVVVTVVLIPVAEIPFLITQIRLLEMAHSDHASCHFIFQSVRFNNMFYSKPTIKMKLKVFPFLRCFWDILGTVEKWNMKYRTKPLLSKPLLSKPLLSKSFILEHIAIMQVYA